MNELKKSILVKVSANLAFHKFLNELHAWWPKAYTWSQDALEDIRIEGRKDGLCTEVGPYGFRCDWGRVTGLVENKKIAMKWQISPNRTPVPDPGKASDLEIRFVASGSTSTVLEFKHINFERHGEGAAAYRKAMDSEQGWDYILGCFKAYCEDQPS